MYKDNNLLYIISILESIEKISIYTGSFHNAEDFLWSDDQKNFNATLNLLVAVGEETRKIQNELKGAFSNINWKDIESLRNRIAHDYRGIDPNIVWDVVRNYLPELKETLVKMLEMIDFKKDTLKEAIQSKYYMHLKYLLDKK
jgi:uncharacterized protein with HEPN domain